MADGLKKAAVWLGLMSDTPYPEDERDDAIQETAGDIINIIVGNALADVAATVIAKLKG